MSRARGGISIGLLLLFLLPGGVSADTVRLEGELADSTHNLGGDGLLTKLCDHASRNQVMAGMDCEGEWIQWQAELWLPMSTTVGVVTAADDDLVCELAIEVRDSLGAEVLTASLQTLPGSGTG